MAEKTIRVVLADDHAVVRAGMRTLLSATGDIEVVGEGADGAEAVELVKSLDPDVLVMDLSMPRMGGAAATSAISAAGARTRILILTMQSPDDTLIPLLEGGAAGFLPKDAADRELVEAVRVVARGDSYLHPSVVGALSGGLRKRADVDEDQIKLSQLTQREREVLRCVAKGHTSAEIGKELFISPKTVDTYRARIQEKLGLSHRSEYVQFALKVGLLS